MRAERYTDNMSIQWNPIYSVHIRVIDEQHQHFVSVLSRLDDAIRSGANEPTELEAIFVELALYGKIHFDTEEMYFDQFNYEGAVDHKARHAEFAATLASYHEKIHQDPRTLSVELVEFLHDWLSEHIAKADKEYVKCFHEHGLS